MKNFIGLLDIVQVPLKIIPDFVSLVIFPPVNTNYLVLFTDLDLIHFILSGLCFKSFANYVAQIHPYLLKVAAFSAYLAIVDEPIMHT